MERRKPKTLKPKRNALCRLRGERLARVEGCVRKPPPHAHRVPILAEGVRLSPSRATTKHAFHAASRARVEVCRKVPTHAHRVPILAEGVRLSPSRATTKHAFH